MRAYVYAIVLLTFTLYGAYRFLVEFINPLLYWILSLIGIRISIDAFWWCLAASGFLVTLVIMSGQFPKKKGGR
jgi:hypothetical protein